MGLGGKANFKAKVGATKQANDVRKPVMQNKRVTGKVIEWKGKFGWISANQPISHPAASQNGGRIYFGQQDVESDISGIGALVNFVLYADNKGLGAKQVRAGGAGKQNNGPALKGSAAGKPQQQKQQQQGGKWGNQAAKGGNGAAQSGPKQKLFGGQRMTGTVSSWKGKYGWITPSQKINHPDAAKKNGLYFSQEDVEQEIQGVGSTVSFIVYKDKSGLGGMHVRPGKAGKGQVVQQQGKQAKQGKQGKQQQQQQTKQVKNLKLKGQQKKQQAKKEKIPFEQLTRKAVSGTSLTGTIMSVRGDVAWIRPDGDIEHAKWAEAKRKDLFVHKNDIEGGEMPKRGGSVLFTVYEDERGLGAEGCQVMEMGDGNLPEHLQAEIDERKKNAANNKTKGKKQQQQPAKKNAPKVGAFAKKQAEKKKQAGKKEKGPSGPDLPRKRVSKEIVTGEVLHMGKDFGWVKPTEPFVHELSEKHGGKIYLHKNDITAGAEVKKGSTVTFHVYSDASGLGAEECS